MEQVSLGNLGARRDEDIALDLMKFIAITAGVGRAAVPTAGFVAGAGQKSDDQITHLLELYSHCLQAIRGK